jgi:N12 class adenine-specific DNA methylase
VIVTDALARGLGQTPADVSTEKSPATLLPTTGQEWDGTITAQPDGSFTIARAGEQDPFTVPKAHAAELRDLLALRDGARSLLELEAANSDDTPELDGRRTALADLYTGYVDHYGPVNRYTTSERIDKETGESIVTHRPASAVRILRQTDPFGALPGALENFNEETQNASPGPCSSTGRWWPANPSRRGHR